MGMNLFAQIQKVDEAKRLVFGRAAEEAVDKAAEIMDYASSKPHFQKWSEEIAKDSGGKNLGNVRAMHGKVAAGGLTQIDFNDADKAVDVCAKIVDENEWQKVLAGTYTGFSIGGSYVGDKKVEKVDGKDVTRYTAKPSEISLVDRPCMPGAKFFEVQKADGAVAKVEFQEPAADAAANDESADDVTVNGTPEQIAELGKLMNANGLTLSDVLEKALPAFLATKAAPTSEPEKINNPVEKADAGSDVLADSEKALDALAKVGARNSTADKARLAKIHDTVVELGHECAGHAEKLAKAEQTNELQKLVTDAVAPLQKMLDEAAAKITKLEAQPAPARVALRAISKAADVIEPAQIAAAPPIVKDDHGETHEAASLIKSLHATGGAPLAKTRL